jgi:CBS domain-containing protein
MTRDVLLARADWSVHRLAEFLAENSISGAPVISEDGKLIGVVSATDIVIHDTSPLKEIASGAPHDYYLQASERGYTSEKFASSQIAGEPLVTVRDIMTPVIYKVAEDTLVPKVADTMIKNRIHRVFVTRDEQLVGIIATPEMLQVVRDL